MLGNVWHMQPLGSPKGALRNPWPTGMPTRNGLKKESCQDLQGLKIERIRALVAESGSSLAKPGRSNDNELLQCSFRCVWVFKTMQHCASFSHLEHSMHAKPVICPHKAHSCICLALKHISSSSILVWPT